MRCVDGAESNESANRITIPMRGNEGLISCEALAKGLDYDPHEG